MKKAIFLFSLSVLAGSFAQAQVGIGNPNPNAGSILDLSNTNNKALLMPTATLAPSSIATFNTDGMLFYYSDALYLNTSTGINVLTPWIYDGTAANGFYSPSGTPVGVGLTPTASSTVRLQVADGSSDVTAASTNGGIAVGTYAGNHLLIDANEIMAKSNATTASALKLQEEGGTVEVRSSGADAGETTVVTAYGSIDAKGKMRENGNDLLPLGTIVMWAGLTAPAGWAICDGGSYARMDGTGNVTVPDLRERFIVGAGSADNATVTGTTQYAIGAGGNGNNFITLGIGEIPAHNHTGSTSSAGDHTHTYLEPGGDNNCWCGCACTGSSLANPRSTQNTGTAGAHTHTLSINNSGGGGAHENRPPYYALAFIYKL